MSSVCPVEPRVNSHLSSNYNEKFLNREFGAHVGCIIGGYKTKSDENFTKSTRKRNKKRANKEIILEQQTDALAGSGDWNRTSFEKYNGYEETTVQEIIDDANVRSSSRKDEGEALIKVTSSNSYAAVVSGRNGRDLIKSDSLNSGLDIDNFVPLVSTSTMSVCEQNISSSSSSVSTRDVGVQVNIKTSTASENSSGKSRSKGTMTDKKGRYRNKFVSVKTCCTNDVLATSHPTAPPVQFLGNDFTFQNALAKTAAQLGIRFMDGMDDDDIQI